MEANNIVDYCAQLAEDVVAQYIKTVARIDFPTSYENSVIKVGDCYLGLDLVGSDYMFDMSTMDAGVAKQAMVALLKAVHVIYEPIRKRINDEARDEVLCCLRVSENTTLFSPENGANVHIGVVKRLLP